MVYVSQGLNPKSREMSWSQTLSPLVQQVQARAQQNRQREQNIAQGTVLDSIFSGLKKKGENLSAFDVLQGLAQAQQQGVDPGLIQQYAKAIPDLMQQQTAASKVRGDQMSAQNAPQKLPKSTEEFVKNAYTQEQQSKQAAAASKQLRDIVERKNVSKFGTGTLSSRAYDEQTQKDIGAFNTVLPQLIYFHKGMFPRGITQGEYLALSKKLPQVGQTYEEQIGALDEFDKLTNLASQKADAIRRSIEQTGAIQPYLEFFLNDIDKQAEQEWGNILNKYGVSREQSSESQMPQGQGEGGGIPGSPEVLGRSQSEKPQHDSKKEFLVRNRKSGETTPVPKEFYEEAKSDPDYEILEPEMKSSAKRAFGETEEEYEDRQKWKAKVLRKNK